MSDIIFKYDKTKFNKFQLFKIEQGLKDGLDVYNYCK